MKLLGDLPASELTPEEGLERYRATVELLLVTGQSAQIAEALPNFRKDLGPFAVELSVYYAAALGDYPELHKALDALIAGQVAKGRVESALAAARFVNLSPGFSLPQPRRPARSQSQSGRCGPGKLAGGA